MRGVKIKKTSGGGLKIELGARAAWVLYGMVMRSGYNGHDDDKIRAVRDAFIDAMGMREAVDNAKKTKGEKR